MTKGADEAALDDEQEQDGAERALSSINIRRSKPFKYAYEKEIVMYAYFKKLDYFSTECIYSPNAYRGHARTYLKDLESVRQARSSTLSTRESSWSSRMTQRCQHSVSRTCTFLSVSQHKLTSVAPTETCTRCGYISSNALCKACVLLEGLNRGVPTLGVRSDRSRVNRMALEAQATTTDIGRVIPRFEATALSDPSSAGADAPAPVQAQ